MRYLSGDATSDERTELVEALRVPAQRQRFEALRLIWDNASRPSALHFDTEAALARMNLPPPPRANARAPERKSWWCRRPRWLFRSIVAATMLLAAAIAIPQLGRNAPRDSVWVEHHAEPGGRAEFTLTDGTRITLNSGSSLWVPDTFNQARRVRLKGEALFAVTHSDDHPFVLEAGDLRVTVLGTAFDASCYGNGEASSVSLLEGRLLVTRQDTNGSAPDALLVPGQRYVLDPVSEQATVSAFDKESVVAWTQDRLVFKRERIGSAIRKIERRYGIEMVLDSPDLGEGTITAHTDNESLDEVLAIVAFAAHARYRVEHEDGKIVKVVFEQED